MSDQKLVRRRTRRQPSQADMLAELAALRELVDDITRRLTPAPTLDLSQPSGPLSRDIWARIGRRKGLRLARKLIRIAVAEDLAKKEERA